MNNQIPPNPEGAKNPARHMVNLPLPSEVQPFLKKAIFDRLPPADEQAVGIEPIYSHASALLQELIARDALIPDDPRSAQRRFLHVFSHGDMKIDPADYAQMGANAEQLMEEDRQVAQKKLAEVRRTLMVTSRDSWGKGMNMPTLTVATLPSNIIGEPPQYELTISPNSDRSTHNDTEVIPGQLISITLRDDGSIQALTSDKRHIDQLDPKLAQQVDLLVHLMEMRVRKNRESLEAEVFRKKPNHT